MMTQSERDGNENDTFYHFTDEAPEEIKNIFLKHFNVRDQDYMIFNHAIDTLIDIFPIEQREDLEEQIEEWCSDIASYYTAERLELLNVWNEEEITEIVGDCNCSISEACAMWYDNQVRGAAQVIIDWIYEA